ncbi:MAG TPA: T9SS type A sorting domain-containing protein [Bacteroidales bacterium]|nr:T9SS type A sorting domain-containing protein [Bacteroidales bacterium]
MKRLLLPLLAFCLLFSLNQNAHAQDCTPDETVVDTANPGQIEPDSLPPAVVDENYDVEVTIIPPASTDVMGSTVELEAIRIDSIGNLPPGLNWYKNEDVFYVTDPVTHYCVNLYGVPEEQGDFQLTLYITAIDAIMGLETPVTDDTSMNIVVNGPVGIPHLASDFNLSAAFPNPFRSQTSINFTAAKQGEAELNVYNLLGKLIYKERLQASSGKNRFEFNGLELQAGTYIYTVEIHGKKETARLIKSE